MARPFCVLTILLFGCLQLSANIPCVNDTLASYEALGPGGCTIFGLTVSDFSFSSSGVGTIPASDMQIMVSPDPFRTGLIFSNFGSVSGVGSANYLIGYKWDPTADIRGAGDILDPGPVDITTDGCIGVAFSGSSCSGTPFTLHVFEGGMTAQHTDTVAFSPVAILGIRNNISLNAMGGTAAFKTFENYVQAPEPGSVLLLLVFSVLLAVGHSCTFFRKPG